MKKNLLLLFLVAGVVSSCGTQKRLSSATQKAIEVKEIITENNATLDSLQKTTLMNQQYSEKDSLLSISIMEVIKKLQDNLNKIGETVHSVELASGSKRNFNDRNYFTIMKPYIDRLDSFQTSSKARERVYGLLIEAVKLKAFVQFDLGTFFEAGVYRIPSSGLPIIAKSFNPVLDSVIQLSNRYTDVTHRLYLVFVGYADGQAINKEGKLYKDLSNFYPKNNLPEKEQLNLTLSNLRAGELLRNMKMVVQSRANDFAPKDISMISYAAYGRGEIIPFSKITDYKENDERRRVVVFYWSVLPVVRN